ncbi:RdgB/HAM1 family non-canonical purine NTP pyrophosphatase [Legionella worsleiensis]|uniref:dITP/XTP pyrophosphatase n=1 Tax=Legionella worsleiensis TaxID=45076 RepID=A0A0W1AAA5_9GAMM|nr:RdgB/HAM1 family non-canonical purine NTP pyrophosphatase [Legionella worsleiensis]KTD78269.1 deoxyribonucleotide triphosphate pyrophosphatase [Legionella worsleiensis]STY32606.1 ribosomal protein Ham1 [Legionella worsleiensis]
MNEIILATGNKGKIREFQELLAPIRCIAQSSLGIDGAEETGLSFIENAIIKARHVSSLAKKPALADDSGLVVPSLNGQPGIYSARYAGQEASDQDNIQLLLENMKDLPTAQRHAYFYCAIALVQHATDPTPFIATGILHGSIALAAVGSGGFGYDPVFFIAEHQCTAAELPAQIKNSISHRAKALHHLREYMPILT